MKCMSPRLSRVPEAMLDDPDEAATVELAVGRRCDTVQGRLAHVPMFGRPAQS